MNTSTGKVIESTLNPINFEFRFDRDIAQHESAIKIRSNLVQNALKKFNILDEPVQKLDLYPVARAGKSGSEVFYLDFYIETASYPKKFIAKFQNIKKTDEEAKAAKKAAFASLCPNVISAEDKENDLGIILYDLAKVKNHQEFRGYFLDENNSSENCAIAIKSILQDIGLHRNTNEPDKMFVDDFKKYVHRKQQPIDKLWAFKKTSSEYSGFSQIASHILDSYNKLIREFDFSFTPYLVHGDLHARNLMLNIENPNQTELIDFGWTHYGHPAKDFVLLEITLKYMLLSELLLNTKSRDRDDPFHLPLNVFEKFEIFLCENCFTLPNYEYLLSKIPELLELKPYQNKALERVYLCLIEVRKEAGRILREFTSKHDADIPSAEQNYFASLFLVTLGLSEFSEMQPVWTLIGLDKIGAAIWQHS
ncbi:phosphotransferase [Acinetobacter pittii]|uniref:phosphotransferase n=1 Tax=Acinetobacter pittii TaxID=48296 RepID=UPI00355B96F3